MGTEGWKSKDLRVDLSKFGSLSLTPSVDVYCKHLFAIYVFALSVAK
jgi:hypothetical protein